MKPIQLVGQDIWQKLKQGAVLSGVARGEVFKTEKKGWLRWVVSVANPINWFRSGKRRHDTVHLIRKKALSLSRNHQGLMTLKLAAAGIIIIKKVDIGGRLVTSAAKVLDQSKVEALCELPNSTKELVEKIPTSRIKRELRTVCFSDILKDDLATAESHDGGTLPADIINSPVQQEIQQRLSSSLKSGLYELSKETETERLY